MAAKARYIEAINRALHEELERDDQVLASRPRIFLSSLSSLGRRMASFCPKSEGWSDWSRCLLQRSFDLTTSAATDNSDSTQTKTGPQAQRATEAAAP